MNWEMFWKGLQSGYLTFPTADGNAFIGIPIWLVGAVLLLLLGLAAVVICAVGSFVKKQSR